MARAPKKKAPPKAKPTRARDKPVRRRGTRAVEDDEEEEEVDEDEDDEEVEEVEEVEEEEVEDEVAEEDDEEREPVRVSSEPLDEESQPDRPAGPEYREHRVLDKLIDEPGNTPEEIVEHFYQARVRNFRSLSAQQRADKAYLIALIARLTGKRR